jgi:16S rRNA (guanine1207-N2)-methyltransferase
MSSSRLSHALGAGGLMLPDEGRIAVFNPPADFDPAGIAVDRISCIQSFKPSCEALSARGFDVQSEAQDGYGAALICLPRARDHARALVAQAVRATQGLIIIDGAKTDGVEPLLKALKSHVELNPPLSKSRGKITWFTAGSDQLDDWCEASKVVEGGFTTRPGVFSADGPDKGSIALLTALPSGLKGRGADLGAGWGFLARDILERETVTALDLVEADKRALDCARLNVTDPRAQFHWADATRFHSDTPYDFVISNPPFHQSRKPEPDLGQAFITTAARLLKPKGTFWMVANRHLPYEATLAQRFARVEDMGGTSGFKILCAASPRRAKR